LSQFTANEDKSWVPGPIRGVVRRGLASMLQAIDGQAAGIVAATPTIAARYTNPRTVVVGNEARLQDFDSCAPEFASRRLLFTGDVGPGHLFDDVVMAVEGVSDARLAVAGRDPSPSAWADAQARLGNRLGHLGWLDRAGLCRAMGDSAVGLATYADTDSYAVAAPTKLFEFCAAGLPVVASPNLSNVRMIGEGGGGFLADGFTADAIARAVESALSDPVAWHAASARGRQWATRVGSWEHSERRLLDLYELILGM
jgi:glycosyltransferase involved in cell wall biosynthesis